MGDPIVAFPLSLGSVPVEQLPREACATIFCAAVALIIVAAFLETLPRPKDRFMLCVARPLRLFGFSSVRLKLGFFQEVESLGDEGAGNF
jgi:hypothetical protein